MAKPICFIILIIIVAIIGVSVGLNMKDGSSDKTIEENKELREKLNKEIYNVSSLRLALSEERKVYEQMIKESSVRYNELERLHKKNEEALRSEVDRLKKSTVKELEDEAERIYTAGCKH